MAEPANVRLSLTSQSENVLLVREMLTGVSETIGLQSSDLYDIRTAVTEACNNVVLHAYEGREGPLEVELRTSLEEVEVIVRDHGVGIRPRLRPPTDAALGIGLPLIQALVRSVEFSEADDTPAVARDGTDSPASGEASPRSEASAREPVAGSTEQPGAGGTEVRMVFQTPSQHTLEPVAQQAREEIPPKPEGEQGMGVSLAIAPARLARAVLPRILCVLAARANFSTDRISDAQLVADSLAAHVPSSLEASVLRIAIGVSPRSLELCVGPLGAGSADRLILDSSVQGLGPVIEKLTDGRRVAAVGSSEMLALQLVDRP